MFHTLPQSLFCGGRLKVNTSDVIDACELCLEVVESEASLEEMKPVLWVIDVKWEMEASKTPLDLPHAPLRCLLI